METDSSARAARRGHVIAAVGANPAAVPQSRPAAKTTLDSTVSSAHKAPSVSSPFLHPPFPATGKGEQRLAWPLSGGIRAICRPGQVAKTGSLALRNIC